jgi:hypothetical protein
LLALIAAGLWANAIATWTRPAKADVDVGHRGSVASTAKSVSDRPSR